MKTKLVRVSLVIAIGRWKSDKQALHVRERCIDNFKRTFLGAILHVL